LNTIKHILARYTLFLWAVLKPLGAWGVFVVAGLDAAAYGLPLDVVVAGYVYQVPSRFLLYVLMAAAGSTVGCIVLYAIGYEGGEALLRKRISPERFERIHGAFDQHPFWSLMLPAMLPPPTPFKLFVLAAAVSEMRFGHFLLAIFSGRLVRFMVLALLTRKFGPQIVDIAGTLVQKHLSWILGALVAGLLIWLLMRMQRGNSKSLSAKAAEK
jgi:membrane protein YqaA with SNARE-associated domain